MSPNWVTVVGFLAGICTTAAFLPQAIRTITTKKTRDISLLMYVIFLAGLAMWFGYGLLRRDLPVVLANGVTLGFAGLILSYKIKYK